MNKLFTQVTEIRAMHTLNLDELSLPILQEALLTLLSGHLRPHPPSFTEVKEGALGKVRPHFPVFTPRFGFTMHFVRNADLAVGPPSMLFR